MIHFLWKGAKFLAQVLMVILVGYYSFEWLMQSMVHNRKEVTVPDIKGKTLRGAVTELSKMNLALALEGEEHAPDAAVGSVIKQYPVSGSIVREGKIISVVASIGSEKISVPELMGLPLRKAEIEIKAAQLILGETEEVYSLQQPRGSVVNQDPKPLSLTEKGDLVHLTISLGEPPPNKLIIPDFAGKEMEQAVSWAQHNNILLHIAEDWTSPEAPNGSVIRQNLKPDSLFDKDTIEESALRLEITVSRRANVATGGRFLEYKVPNKPNRKRELVLKILDKTAEREVFRTLADPGQTARIPLGADQERLRIRIYLDGVFTEERNIQ